jgi:hypothetical protein
VHQTPELYFHLKMSQIRPSKEITTVISQPVSKQAFDPY